MERITERLLSWASILDPNAREQAITTATVGSVIPTLRAAEPGRATPGPGPA